MWQTLAAVLLAVVLGLFAGLGLDRLPHGWPDLHVGPLHLGLPDSLAAQRDAARSSLLQSHENVVGLEGAIKKQNAAVDEAEARTKATLHALDQASSASQSARAVADQKAKAILARQASGDRCLAAEAVLRGR